MNRITPLGTLFRRGVADRALRRVDSDCLASSFLKIRSGLILVS